MSGRDSGLNPLELRKRLLIAESELNRAQAVQECHAMTQVTRDFMIRFKSIGSIASTGALLLAGVSAFRRSRAAHRREKASWIQIALRGAQAAGSIWVALRSRRNASPEGDGENSDAATSRASFLLPRE
jgi:hypothetical protein